MINCWLSQSQAKVDYIVNEIDATVTFARYRHLRRSYMVEEERIYKELQS